MNEGLLMKAWQWLLASGAVVGGALVLGSGDDRAEPDDDDADPLPDSPKGRDLIPNLCEQAGVPEDIATLLNFVAVGESGWNPRVGFGLPDHTPAGVKIRYGPTEAKFAARAYHSVKKRHPATLEGCTHPEAHYTFGSGGLFAALPVYWIHHLRSTPLRCASPFEVFDPAFAIAGAYSFARGIQRNGGYQGTVKSLRAGWGSLKRMQVPSRYAHKLPKWRKHAQRVGKPSSYIDGPAPTVPKRDLYELYKRLGGRL